MATKADWQETTGKVWAGNIQLTDRAFSGLTQIMLEQLASISGSSIVDIGCGGGELSLALAEARPSASVVGVDVSDDLIEAARRRGADFANLRFELADAAGWNPSGAAPDLLVSRHGVMFFDDPVAAFRHLHEIAASDAQMFFSCFRDPAENAWLSEAAQLLDLPTPAPHAPGPFAFAEEDYVRSILSRSGWRNICLDPVDFGFLTGAGDDPMADALRFFTRIGPAARAIKDMEEAGKADALLRLQRWLASHRTGDFISLKAAAWIVTARKRD
jgi:SAM-dependent methyltransferase